MEGAAWLGVMEAWNALTSTVGQFIDSYGLIAIFVVTLLKEIGVPVPVPSDLIMLAAAIQSAAGKYVAWQASAAILISTVIGDMVQYSMIRGFGHPFVYRFGRNIGLTENRLDRAMAAVRKGGIPAVILSLSTPGVCIAIIPACGLAELPYRKFFADLVIGSAIFIGLHFVVGYFASPILNLTLSALNVSVLAVVVVISIIGFTAWMIMSRPTITQKRGGAVTALVRAQDWLDATCPVCLAIDTAHTMGDGDRGTDDETDGPE